MTFTLRIDTDNAAFGEYEDATRAEVSRLLRVVATVVNNDQAGASSGRIRDVNGNTVGQWAWED